MSAEQLFIFFFHEKIGRFVFFPYLCLAENEKHKEMANKRTLKHAINGICEELFAECIAASLYGTEKHKDDADALLFTILKIRSNYIRRVSYPEPGITTKAYFKDLREKFTAQVSEVVDQINNL